MLAMLFQAPRLAAPLQSTPSDNATTTTASEKATMATTTPEKGKTEKTTTPEVSGNPTTTEKGNKATTEDNTAVDLPNMECGSSVGEGRKRESDL